MDRVILMQTDDHLGIFIAQIVHDGIVQAAIARARVQRNIFDADPAQHLCCDVARPAHLRIADVLRAIKTLKVL